MKSVEGIDHGRYGAVESEGESGGAQVVIDRFRDADDWPALAVKLQGGVQRAIPSDHDQRPDFQTVHRFLGLGDDLGRDLGDVALADLGGEVALVRGAEDGATEFKDADGVLGLEDREIAGREQALEAVPEADHLPAELVGRADDAVDDRIETGAIATAVEDPDFHELTAAWAR